MRNKLKKECQKSERKHYSDVNGQNVVHMPTPITLSLDPSYDYLRSGFAAAAGNAILKTLAMLLVYPFLRLFLGFRIIGRENVKRLKNRGFVAVSNHVHVMDSPMTACAIGFRRTYFVSAASNFCIPVIRHLVRALGAVPLSDEPSQVMKMFSEMEKAISANKAVQFFPEGFLIPYGSEIRPFRRGAFKLAGDTGAAVLPMVFTYQRPGGVFRHLKRKPFVTLHILPAVEPDPGLSARQAGICLEKEVYQIMNRCFTESQKAGNTENQ